MKKKRIIIFGVLVVLGAAYIITIIPNFRHRAEWNRVAQALRGMPRERIDSAVEAFVRAQKAQGRAVSETVSLRTLISGGFLRADEAAPFRGTDVIFAIGVDRTRPQQMVARVPLPDGRVLIEMADGSIQQLSR